MFCYVSSYMVDVASHTSDAGLIIFFPLRYFTPLAVLEMKILNIIIGGNLSPPNLHRRKANMEVKQ